MSLKSREEDPALAFYQAALGKRLMRLARVKCALEKIPNADPLIRRLVDRGLFATYRDCKDQGLGDDARVILGI